MVKLSSGLALHSSGCVFIFDEGRSSYLRHYQWTSESSLATILYDVLRDLFKYEVHSHMSREKIDTMDEVLYAKE